MDLRRVHANAIGRIGGLTAESLNEPTSLQPQSIPAVLGGESPYRLPSAATQCLGAEVTEHQLHRSGMKQSIYRQELVSSIGRFSAALRCSHDHREKLVNSFAHPKGRLGAGLRLRLCSKVVLDRMQICVRKGGPAVRSPGCSWRCTSVVDGPFANSCRSAFELVRRSYRRRLELGGVVSLTGQ